MDLTLLIMIGFVGAWRAVPLHFLLLRRCIMGGQSAGNSSDLRERLRGAILDRSLIQPGDHVLAAVSGGVDSMVMLDVLAGLAPALGFRLSAASLDHGLRGDQGKAECELVARRCQELGIEHRSGTVDTAARVETEKSTIQEAARELRYEFLRRCCRELGANRLTLAHHRDDQAETVLLRLFSGSGLTGLAGMRHSSENGFLIRPLLDIPRRDIEEYAREHKLAWAEDPSNSSVKYFRNRLRLEVIPELEHRLDPEFRARLAGLGQACAELDSAVDTLAGPLRDKVLLSCGWNETVLSCEGLAGLPSLLRRHILRGEARRLAGEGAIISGRPLAALEGLILSGRSGHGLDLPFGLHARREFGRLRLNAGEHKPRPETEALQATILSIPGSTAVRLPGASWEMELREYGWDASSRKSLWRESGALVQTFDREALDFPLTAGTWNSGERVVPFGLKGSRKLKKSFLEARVPAGRRLSIPVIRDARGRVVWAPGVVRSALAPVTDSTVTALDIRARELQAGLSDTPDQH